MASVSTHVLDSASGGGRAGVVVELHGPGGDLVASGRTDTEGRIASLASGVDAGTFRLTWHLDLAWLAEVAVTVRLDDDRHYHIPCLASPASAVTYLGV